MAISDKDKTILRDLAKRLTEIAALPIQKEKAELWRRLNRLERTRPLVMLQNGTWHETGGQIKLETQDEFARKQEWNLRVLLYHWDHMKDDHVYQGVIHSPIVIRDTGWGIRANPTKPDHVFGAKHYNCVIPDNADPSLIPMPTVTVDWAATERQYEQLCDLYDGAIKVEKRGVAACGFAIIDTFIQWRDLDRMFADLADRPEWMHAWLERMTQWHLSRLDQLEKLGVLALNNGCNGVGPGGMGFSDQLPQPGCDGTHVRTRDMWGHATTQIFSLVSPAMHEEFALRYEKRFLGRFGLGSYGCCEPLDLKLDIIKKHLPTLRRVSMSPWVDVARGAEGLGNKYIFSYKPNPAILGMETWDPDEARKQLRDVFDRTRGCIVEVLMKDLHTCRNEPRRMWEWVNMAMELSEELA
ncbi:MAG: hypothetical protein FJ279_28725 [Planctomycetes bacterium]|nr:hypothetical protein [Planctomycetota bacterium]